MAESTVDRPKQELSDALKEAERKSMLEEYLTSGCGFGRGKQKVLDVFWGTVWPALEQVGWRKVDGEGDENGSIVFLPPKVDRATGRRGIDFFDKIKDVIDRIMERRNDDEAKAADAYQAGRQKDDSRKAMDSPPSNRPRRAASSSTSRSVGKEGRTRGRISLSGGVIDLSWKDGGTLYPKRSSRVGGNYQATNIPAAGSFQHGAHVNLQELIWKPGASHRHEVDTFLDTKVPHNKKEKAAVILGLQALANKVDMASLPDIVNKVEPTDGSNWTEEEKDQYNSDMFRLRKDVYAVSKSMGKDMNTCLTYYLGSFKKSDHYRLVKTVYVSEKSEHTPSTLQDACAVCGDGGSLLICDGCEGEYHLSCLRPALNHIPEGHWECDECVDKKLLESREYIIRNCGLYEPVHGSNKKRKAGDQPDGPKQTQSKSAAGDLILRPTSPVLKMVKSFAGGISKALSGPLVESQERSKALL